MSANEIEVSHFLELPEVNEHLYRLDIAGRNSMLSWMGSSFRQRWAARIAKAGVTCHLDIDMALARDTYPDPATRFAHWGAFIVLARKFAVDGDTRFAPLTPEHLSQLAAALVQAGANTPESLDVFLTTPEFAQLLHKHIAKSNPFQFNTKENHHA